MHQSITNRFSKRIFLSSNVAALIFLFLSGDCRVGGAQSKVEEVSLTTIEKNIEYGKADGESLKLDLYLPTKKTGDENALRPAVVFVHGGGWVGGDKSGWSMQAKELAQNGYVAISINYRLAPKHPYPAAVQDCQAAVRWLRVNAVKYHVAVDRIGSMGDSAGGHLASYLGVRDHEIPDVKTSSKVNCVVDYYGRMDLALSGGAHDFRPDFIGKSLPGGLEEYKAASPITYVDKTSAPFLIVQGANDPQVEPVQSYNMMTALNKAGVEATLIVLSGQGHGFNGRPAKDAWKAAKSFFDRHLKRR